MDEKELIQLIQNRDYSSIRLHVDVETFSECDITTAGAYLYADHPSTEFLIFGFRLVVDGLCFDHAWDAYTYDMPDLLDAILNATIPIHAFNAAFERLILNRFFPQYKFPIERFHCTMALAYGLTFSGNLAQVGAQIGLPDAHKKSLAGAAIGRKFWKPQNGKSQDGKRRMPDDDPEGWQGFIDYCMQDVIAEYEIHKFCEYVLEDPDWERELYDLSQQINDRGIPFDRVLINKVNKYVDQAIPVLQAKMAVIADNPDFNPRSSPQVIAFASSHGIEMESSDKAHVQSTIDSLDETHPVRQLLEIKQHMSGTSSLGKWASADRICGKDPENCIMQGGFIYRGAVQTRRDTGSKFQPHNLARPKDNVDNVCGMMLDGSLSLFHPDPINGIAGVIRGVYKAPQGQQICVMDLNGIEDKTYSWISGDHVRLQAQRDGIDTYIDVAQWQFPVGYENITKEQRKFGKILQLACIAEGQLVLTDAGLVPIQDVMMDHRLWDGIEWVYHGGVVYQGERKCIEYDGLIATPDHAVFSSWGGMALQDCLEENLGLTKSGNGPISITPHDEADNYFPKTARHIGIVPVYDILNVGPLSRFTVSDCLVHNCQYGGGVNAFYRNCDENRVPHPPEENVQALINMWRSRNQISRNFSKAVELACFSALGNPGQTFYPGDSLTSKVWVTYQSGFLNIQLPSGRNIYYVRPEMGTGRYGNPAVTYMKMVSETTRIWKRTDTYYGKLMGNINQSVARDVFMMWALECSKRGVNIIGMVHDEILALHNTSECDWAMDTMTEVLENHMPQWSRGLVLGCEGYISERYKK